MTTYRIARIVAPRFATALAVFSMLGCAAETSTPEPTPVDTPAATAGGKEDFAEQASLGKADWTFDPCEKKGWYGDGDCDWFCPKRDTDCSAPPLFANPNGAATQYPIVIHHGFAGGHAGVFAYTGVVEALTGDNHSAVKTEVPPFDAIDKRVLHLKEVVDAVLLSSGAAKVNIIAHSLGGLDTRYLISKLGYADKVASVTTISTPHRGTNVADFALNITPGFADPAVNAIADIIGHAINDNAVSTDVRSALDDLAEANAPTFNSEVLDAPGVYYQSWAGVSSVLGLAKYGHDAELLAACEGKSFIQAGTFDRLRALFVPLNFVVGKAGANGKWHDGLVSVKSAVWGEFKGCIPADHSEQVGQYSGAAPNPNTGFDHVNFYRTVAFDLAARGY